MQPPDMHGVDRFKISWLRIRWKSTHPYLFLQQPCLSKELFVCRLVQNIPTPLSFSWWNSKFIWSKTVSVNGRLPLARKSSLVNLNYALIEKFWGQHFGKPGNSSCCFVGNKIRVLLWLWKVFVIFSYG